MKTRNVLFAFFVIVLLALAFVNCKKSSNEDCDEIQKNNFKCTETTAGNLNMYTYLAKGSYKSQIVYYKNIYCPVCNSVPPAFGLSCSGDTIKFDSFNNVTLIKMIAICK